jgi:hypothetical protein
METQTALERPQGGVELHAEASIDLYARFVVDPGDPEYDLALRLAKPLNQSVLEVMGMLGNDRPKALQYLSDRLMKFHLSGIASKYFAKDGLQLLIEHLRALD